MKKSILALLTASSLIATSAYANSPTDNIDHQGIYIGAGYGLLNVKGDEEDFDKEDNASRVFAGAQLNQMFSIEGGYIDFGNYGNSVFNTDLDGYTLALKAGLPVSERFTVYAQGGNIWWKADINATDASDDVDGSDIFYGAGVSFALTQSLSLRLEYTRLDVEFDRDEIGILAEIDSFDTKVDYANIGIQYTF
ncbi:outer membrane beta-barrel protein [Arsukibacterium indicum]|uniref:Outer membrane beta-barrel protein n=1 Tax=Arsukibacterium indicum TaxID=2848612 RepID=A0ABS6MJZ2_9GAMM|nr:outer membrane beta-barrel protein [Arsukibacterium indicum]MBV2129119.1 outer membrane beta-barrel protein [Arsukibacterium indicum]